MHKKIIHYLKNHISKRKKLKTRKNTIINTLWKDNFKKRKTQLSINLGIFNKIKILGNNILNYYVIPLILIVFLIIFLIFWPLLTVKNINIIKKDDITNINIAYKAIESIRWNKIFTLDKDLILKKLTNYQQNIIDIELKIKFPNTLIIHIESSKWVFNTTINKKQYIITGKWTLIPKKHSNELRTIDILYNFNENVFLDYKDVFQEKYIWRIDSTIKWLEENIIDLKIKSTQYYPIEREIHIILENNTQLLFSINTDTNKQIKKTAIFNKEHIKLNDTSLIYMDLRIKNKVFYCTNEDEYLCNQNLKKIYEK